MMIKNEIITLFILLMLVPSTVAAVVYCDSGADCSDKIQNATVGDTVILTSDIHDFDGTCIDFGNSSGITFDGAGHLIDGIDEFNGNGVYLQRDSSNNTVKNFTITDFRKGVYLYHSDYNTIENVSSRSNRETGATVLYSRGNLFIDCILQDNPEDFYFRPDVYADCDNALINVTGSGDTPIGFYNETVNISNLEYSSLYLCNADESMIDNVTVSGNIRMYYVDGAILTGVVSGGLYMDYSYDNDVRSSLVCDNDHYNIQISAGSRNTLEDVISTGSKQTGIYLYNAPGNDLINVTVSWSMRGIVLDSSDGTLINNSCIIDNRLHGICLRNSGNHLIYGNYFDNDVNIDFGGTPIEISQWNTTIGNYWNDYTGINADGDGFGDTPYNISEGNVDYLPLVISIPQICGDVDNNGYISSNDVVETYRHAVNPNYPISEWAADVDGNGYISANDVVEIYRSAVDPTYTLNCRGI